MQDKIISILAEKLREKRFCHTMGVAKCAKELALRFGEDLKRAYTAGLLHDIVKEDSIDSMQKLCQDLDIDDEMRASRALLHGPAGAEYAKKRFAIDQDVYNACFYHTVGRPNMSKLEKIVYLADVIEENRTQPGVEQLRELAKNDLDGAVLQAMQNTIAYLTENGLKIHKNSLEAMNYLLKSLEKCGRIDL